MGEFFGCYENFKTFSSQKLEEVTSQHHNTQRGKRAMENGLGGQLEVI